ncbi:hypothetical protein SISSUDRAFT_1046911 [Sistotremastrum suecicum HHB10207 ss-3]|uniref:Uncharacterized protein n=1 Tax=Sistotremastrum suecicum HHB10207 ss-3 TaxID=1314776 RepID=A0A166DFT2_9AGAM|nr:hypothetical protein SISSUDRAFT_1046911 [Sistotremastrum suecicum HHB10207 ss-3]
MGENGATIGIAVGITVAAILLLVIGFYIVTRRQAKDRMRRDELIASGATDPESRMAMADPWHGYKKGSDPNSSDPAEAHPQDAAMIRWKKLTCRG